MLFGILKTCFMCVVSSLEIVGRPNVDHVAIVGFQCCFVNYGLLTFSLSRAKIFVATIAGVLVEVLSGFGV